MSGLLRIDLCNAPHRRFMTSRGAGGETVMGRKKPSSSALTRLMTPLFAVEIELYFASQAIRPNRRNLAAERQSVDGG